MRFSAERKDMILITGGSFSGKREYAEKTFGLARECFRDGNEIGKDDLFQAEGVFDFHRYVRRFLTGKSEEELDAFVEKLLREDPDIIVISDEVGCGVVPLDREDRIYREAVGRTCSAIARRADRVDRVVCGLGSILKG